MLALPTPSHVTGVDFDSTYWIVSFGDVDSPISATTVFKNGVVRDSYMVVRNADAVNSYITLDFVKA